MKALRPSGVAEEFTIQRVREGVRGTLILTGRLDRASAPTLEELIAELCVDGAHEVALDVGALTYYDSLGLEALFHARRLCAGYRCTFRILPVCAGAGERPRGERRSGGRRRRRPASLAPARRREPSRTKV